MKYKYVSTVTLPRWSSTDRQWMAGDVIKQNEDKRNATRWHETLHRIKSHGKAEIISKTQLIDLFVVST
jgi:hypothetical protein